MSLFDLFIGFVVTINSDFPKIVAPLVIINQRKTIPPFSIIYKIMALLKSVTN